LILFDVLNKVFQTFLTYKNPLFGGEGFLFVGDYTKTISETVFAEFVEELQVCILFMIYKKFKLKILIQIFYRFLVIYYFQQLYMKGLFR
jgi:hypothetical protein